MYMLMRFKFVITKKLSVLKFNTLLIYGYEYSN